MQRISITNPQNIIDGTAKKYYFKLRNTGGPKGDKGDKGDTGATGPQGPQGNAATVSVGSTTTLPVGYDATVENVGSIYNAVLNFGIPQGPQGPQGAKGNKGDTGAQGETGPRGPQGERGTNATVYVGTTSTLAPGSQATVYNSGTDSNAVLNFGIPQGAKGDTGATGATGATGPAGQNFAATVVAELPETGDSSKLYLTPKAHTTQTATGNPITATVAEQAGKLESFKLDGDTFQQSYTGQNLYNVATLQTGTYVTKDDDGWITITRDNSSGSSSSYTNAWTSNLALETDTQYVIFLEIKAVSGTGEFDITSTNSTQGQFSSWSSKQIASLAAGQVYKVTPTTKSSFSGITGGLRTLLNLSAGQSASITFRLSVLADTSVTVSSFVYEPYVGGQPSPSPSYPQPIQTVTGEQTVSVIGKNLFNKNAVTNGGYIDTNGEVVAWETFGYSEYIRVIGGQTYSYSGTANNVGYSAKAAWYDSNKNFISYFSFGTSGQVTAPATAKFLRTSVRIASPSGLDTYQLELGSTITTYEAYRATNYPLDLGSIELCELGTYQDYIWKDGDSWKVHKATSKATIDSLTDGESSSIDTALTNTTRVKIDKCLGEQASYAGRETPVCNEFGYKLIWNSDESGFYLDIGSDQSKNGIVFRGSKNVIGTTSTAIESWLNSKPITVYYAIATATDTTITDTTLIAQLETIRTAQLATGTNTKPRWRYGDWLLRMQPNKSLRQVDMA